MFCMEVNSGTCLRKTPLLSYWWSELINATTTRTFLTSVWGSQKIVAISISILLTNSGKFLINCFKHFPWCILFRSIKERFQVTNISTVGVKTVSNERGITDHEIESELNFIKTKARGNKVNKSLYLLLQLHIDWIWWL